MHDSPKARPGAQGARQLNLFAANGTSISIYELHTLTSDFGGTSPGVSWCRHPTSNHRGGPANHFLPLGRLLQQQNLIRDHFIVSASPNGIHTAPECKEHWECHTGGRPLRRKPRCYTHLGSPARGVPQHGTRHQNDPRPTSILSTPPPRTGQTRDSEG